MAPLKEYNNNFAASSMPIDVYADVVPQVDIGYQILPWLAGFFLLFLTANILRSISTTSSSSDSSANWSNFGDSGEWQPIAPKGMNHESPEEPVKEPYFSYSMRMTNGVTRWITKLISEPYTFTKQGYTKDRKSIKFYCNGCYAADPCKYTWAIAKIVGYGENNKPELELTRIDHDHVCQPSANVRFLNKIFLDRCYNEIMKNPTERLKKIYHAVRTQLEAEYFTVTPDTHPLLAQQINEQKSEWHSKARTLRNIKTSLYPYRHYFIPKDPVDVHDRVSLSCKFLVQQFISLISYYRINWT